MIWQTIFNLKVFCKWFRRLSEFFLVIADTFLSTSNSALYLRNPALLCFGEESKSTKSIQLQNIFIGLNFRDNLKSGFHEDGFFPEDALSQSWTIRAVKFLLLWSSQKHNKWTFNEKSRNLTKRAKACMHCVNLWTYLGRKKSSKLMSSKVFDLWTDWFLNTLFGFK